MKAEFTKFEKGDNAVAGTCGEYTFSAKLFDKTSSMGINGGRVSKLSIRRDGEMRAHYDRGWDFSPILPNDKLAYQKIMELLENAPKLFG